MVADIDKNIEWHILNFFLIVCFNLRLIIFCLIENAILVPKNSQIVMLEQIGCNAYY